MTIDDLAHEAEVEAEVLRAVSSLGAEKAERLLIALAFRIKGATPKVKDVVLQFDSGGRGVVHEVDQVGVELSRPMHAVQLSPEWNEPIEIPTRAPAGTLGELSQRIVDFLSRAGGTSTMGGIKDACATSKWSRNRVGTEVYNLLMKGTVCRNGEFYQLPIRLSAAEAPAV